MMNLMTETCKLGDQIMESFDFEGVHALMVLNRWAYRSDKNAPNIQELKDTANQLIYTMANLECVNNRCGTGGFSLYRFQWESHIELELVFKWRTGSATVSS